VLRRITVTARPSADKRRKEKERQDRQKEKAERRAQRKLEKPERPEGEDPDIAGIVPGPQPLPEQFAGDEPVLGE
jgi:hypothetical protein